MASRDDDMFFLITVIFMFYFIGCIIYFRFIKPIVERRAERNGLLQEKDKSASKVQTNPNVRYYRIDKK